MPRYPIRNQSSQHNIPPLMPHLVTGGHPPPPLMSLGPPATDRKDYYDSYNRYFRLNSIFIHVHVKQTVYQDDTYLPPPSPAQSCGNVADVLHKSDIKNRIVSVVFISEKLVRAGRISQVLLILCVYTLKYSLIA